MKKLTTTLELERVSSKKDGSLSLGFATPELTPAEKALFMELQGTALKATLDPMVETQVEDYAVDKEIEKLTPSQRLRRSIYVLWTQNGSKGYFDDYYRRYMDKIIDEVKQKLE